MNVPIINTFNLKIIDYTSGFISSQHKMQFDYFTQFVEKYACLLQSDEKY